MKRIMALCAAALFVFVSTSAQAKHHHYRHHAVHRVHAVSHIIHCGRFGCNDRVEPKGERFVERFESKVTYAAADPRPSLWCAWWLRRHLHIPRTAFRPYEYNMARGFLHIGTPAPRGCTNCIAIFSRGRGGHVGLVEGWDANGNPVILSGNFNGHVDTAPHPVSRLIGLRWWS